jgi:hypothetical protein
MWPRSKNVARDVNSNRVRKQMRRTILFAGAAVFILAAVGGWMASYTQARVTTPTDGRARIDPFNIMLNTKQLHAERFEDFSMLN